MKEFLKRHSLILGILLMFLFTWPIDLSNSGVLPLRVPFIIYLFLGWGFIFASLIMTGLTLGKDSVIALLKRFLIWRVSWKWYLVVFLLMPSIQFAAIFLNSVLTQTSIDFNNVFARQIFGETGGLIVFVVPFLLIDFIANGEEMGWRGYVLPRLQARYNALISSLILGVIWGFWHFPKFLAPDNHSSFLVFMVDSVAKAVLFTWIYNNTRGSLLLVTLFHAVGNTGGVFLPVGTTVSGANTGTYLIQVGLEILAAILIVKYAGAERLSRVEPKQVQDQATDLERDLLVLPG
jgi:membrane protease YdiL (CAAX protease family)